MLVADDAAAVALSGDYRALAKNRGSGAACRTAGDVTAYYARAGAGSADPLVAGIVLTWSGDVPGAYALLRQAHARAASRRCMSLRLGEHRSCAAYRRRSPGPCGVILAPRRIPADHASRGLAKKAVCHMLFSMHRGFCKRTHKVCKWATPERIAKKAVFIGFFARPCDRGRSRGCTVWALYLTARAAAERA